MQCCGSAPQSSHLCRAFSIWSNPPCSVGTVVSLSVRSVEGGLRTDSPGSRKSTRLILNRIKSVRSHSSYNVEVKQEGGLN